MSIALLAAVSCAEAQEKGPCGQFAWPLSQEKAWLADGLRTLQSGASIDQLSDGAYALVLQPMSAVTFVKPPESPSKSNQSYGAAISVQSVAREGRYQVTLSDEAWIDMVQAGAYARAGEHSGVHGCPGMRKSVRFALQKGPLTIQLSGAPTSSLRLAVKRLD